MSTNSSHRRRANSVTDALANIQTDTVHHVAGPSTSPPGQGSASEKRVRLSTQHTGVRKRGAPGVTPILTRGLWNDLTSMNWTRVPSSALVLMAIPVVLYFQWAWLSPGTDNPFKYLLSIQYEAPGSTPEHKLYRKGYGDLAFLVYYTIVFAFIRQLLTLHVFRPLAIYLGITKEGKIDRFTEQAYALTYWGVLGPLGLWTMYGLDTWYFEGRNFFQNYPYWRIPANLKWYYLLQFSYWLHQLLIMVVGLEKPRKDFYEYVFHHIVTLWLIGWSYLTNMTPMGNAVFVTMDISDVFFAFSKLLNYMQLEKTSMVSFGVFVCVWTYTRHYLNLYMIWATWAYFDLIPSWAKQWAPETGAWMAPWVQWQILGPLVLLQAVNLFWYFLIWRTLIRVVFSREISDEREDDEDVDEPDTIGDEQDN